MKNPTIRELINSEISDFVAGLGQPGYCETPEEIQKELVKRFAFISEIADNPEMRGYADKYLVKRK